MTCICEETLCPTAAGDIGTLIVAQSTGVRAPCCGARPRSAGALAVGRNTGASGGVRRSKTLMRAGHVLHRIEHTR